MVDWRRPGQGKATGGSPHPELREIVRFVGYQANPLPYIKRANLFCLPSLFEGMPNALIEALICRTPVVSFDCPTGPSEILAEGKHGTLVRLNKPMSLAQAIQDAMEHPEAWQARTETAYNSVVERFSLEAGMLRLQNVFEEVVAQCGARHNKPS